MPLQLIELPIANATEWGIRLFFRRSAGIGRSHILLELHPGQAAVVNVTFDRIHILTSPPYPLYVQNPNVTVPPYTGYLGYLGYFRPGPILGGQRTYVLSVGKPNQDARTYTFTKVGPYVY